MEAQRINQILPTVIPNSEQAQTAQTNSQSGLTITSKFALALKSQLVKDSSFEEVMEVLRKAMMKVGLRAQNLPTDLEALVLFEHLISNHGGHRLNEIPLAFDMAIRGSLCDSNGEVIDASCYENFSCLYLSKIIGGYRIWAESEYKVLPTTKPEKQKIFSKEELDDYAREDAEWQYQMFLKGLPLTYPESNDKILRQDGLLKEGETVMDFFKRKAESLATHIYTRMNNNY